MTQRRFVLKTTVHNLRHRFLRKMGVGVFRGGRMLDGRFRNMQFEYYPQGSPAGDYELRARVPFPVPIGQSQPTSAQPILDLRQSFRINERGEAVLPEDGHAQAWSVDAVATRDPSGAHGADHAGSAEVVIDVLFLDVTEYFVSERQGGIMLQLFQPRDGEGRPLGDPPPRRRGQSRRAYENGIETVYSDRLTQAGQPPQVALDPARMNQCKLRVLQNTMDGTVWHVLIPDTLPDDDEDVDVILGYLPQTGTYESVDNVDLQSLRWLLATSDGLESTRGGRVEETPWNQFTNLVDGGLDPVIRKAAHVIRPRIAIGGGHWGIDLQLARAQKKAIVACVQPRGSDYGLAGRESFATACRHLLHTLKGSGVVPSKKLRNVILADFESGAALAAIADHKRWAEQEGVPFTPVLKEIWLHAVSLPVGRDGAPREATKQLLREWLDGGDDHRLRILPGVGVDMWSRWAGDLGISDRVSVVIPSADHDAKATMWPRHVSFYVQSKVVGRAFWTARLEDHRLTPTPEALETVTEARLRARVEEIRQAGPPPATGRTSRLDGGLDEPAGSLTAKTGIFVVERSPQNDSATTIVAQLPNGRLTTVADLPYMHREWVGLFVARVLGERVQNERHFRWFVGSCLLYADVWPRQWPTLGAQCAEWEGGATEEIENAKGYFELCLATSPTLRDGSGTVPPARPASVDVPLAERLSEDGEPGHP